MSGLKPSVLEKIPPLLNTITERRTCMLFTEFWLISACFTRHPCNGQLPQRLKFISEASWKSKIDRQVFYLKCCLWYEKRVGFKFKYCSLLSLMAVLVIFKYSLCVHVYVWDREGERQTDMESDWKLLD